MRTLASRDTFTLPAAVVVAGAHLSSDLHFMTQALQPLCFVLMPFGKKPDSNGRVIDFDQVYREIMVPAITQAGMEPLRADEEVAGGLIHKPMFERLVLCDFAVADLTTANANVFYELGLRHGVRPWSTVMLVANETKLPFDIGPMRVNTYALNERGIPSSPNESIAMLAGRLRDARNAIPDSPVFQLVDDLKPQTIDRLKTDTFRNRIAVEAAVKRRLAIARHSGIDEVRSLAAKLEVECPIDDTDAGIVIDLFLSLRAVSAWRDMIELMPKMSRPLGNTLIVQEQLALAHNRAGNSAEAEDILNGLLKRHGPSSETYGLLGRVFKDRWEKASKEGRVGAANNALRRAIDSYRRGFEADWRDAYPGINAVTLMEISDPPDDRRFELLPVVRYAVRRRRESSEPDYWDHASWLELAVLAGDRGVAASALSDAIASVREPWEPETTARNIRLIRESRERRAEDVGWIKRIEDRLATYS